MINPLEMTGVHLELTPDVEKYIEKKIGKLDRYIPKHARKTVKGKVVITEDQGKSTNKFKCEAILDLPGERVVAKAATINMFAAIDIVEAKVKSQLLKYKGKRTDKKRKARKFWRSNR